MATGGMRVILFDDLPEHRTQLKRDLESEDLEIIAPESCQEAILMLKKGTQRFDCILIDHHFSSPHETDLCDWPDDIGPIPDGSTLCQEMLKIDPTIPIIVYTTVLTDAVDPAVAVSKGAYRVVREYQLEGLVKQLHDRVEELSEISDRLKEIQDSHRSMSYVLAGVGIGFQLVDTHGRIWFRDEVFNRIVGDSGLPYEICYCKSHGYPIEHGMCKNCLAEKVAKTEQAQFQVFFSPTYPEGPGTTPVFKYLSVQVSPVRARGTSEARNAISQPPIAVLEGVSELFYSPVIASMNLRDHLRILVRGLSDMGFERVRVYRATRIRDEGQWRPGIQGLVFCGPVAPGVEPEKLVIPLLKEPTPTDPSGASLAEIINESDFVKLTAEQNSILLLEEDFTAFCVALFNAAGDFIGWVALDKRASAEEDPSDVRAVTENDLLPNPRSEFVPPQPMTIMQEIAKVIASKPYLAGLPVSHIEAEHAFTKIQRSVVSRLDIGPEKLIRRVLEAVREEFPSVVMAHVRRLENEWAVSVESIGKYGVVAERRVNTLKSRRLTSKVARTGVPEFVNAIKELDQLPGRDEFTDEQRNLIWSCPSHGVFPLLSEGRVIGTASFQVNAEVFFTAHRQHLFRLIADLLADALRDYLSHLRDVQAIASDLGRRAAYLVVHNVNHPVSTIRNRVQLAKFILDKKPLVEADLRRHLKIIDDQCLRIASIRTDFMSLFGLVATLPEVTDAHGVIRRTVAEALGGQPAPSVSYDLDPTLQRIRTQPRVIETVLSVFIRNSLDAWQEKGSFGKLTVIFRGPSQELPLEARFVGSCAAVDVIDDGSGVSGPAEDRLFEPFQSTKPDGLGIGLAYARDMARGLGGDVYFGKGDRRGTRFTLLVPASVEPETQT